MKSGVITEISPAEPEHALSAELQGEQEFKGKWNIPDDVPNALKGRNQVPVNAPMWNYKDGKINGQAQGYFYWKGSLHFYGNIYSDGRLVVKQGDITFEPGFRTVDEKGNIILGY